ncbi:hypothetical protein [Mesorhizobium sp. B2-8-9]|uniref:hypothetical protein n=1 Tax=Mesorhizobium sp. B2-8-9 TaxID=2589899 RepID=UPI0011266537|nr:hypothetical protein [Mesorhizobium sp. B2-8-9]TPI78466.1 hypothetical protein FJ423_16245 [Mesorhizobium sp. B2-8-9]
MDFDPAFLSRLEFAWVIGWRVPLPAITVGLAAFIAMLEDPRSICSMVRLSGLVRTNGRLSDTEYYRPSLLTAKAFGHLGMPVLHLGIAREMLP